MLVRSFHNGCKMTFSHVWKAGHWMSTSRNYLAAERLALLQLDLQSCCQMARLLYRYLHLLKLSDNFMAPLSLSVTLPSLHRLRQRNDFTAKAFKAPASTISDVLYSFSALGDTMTFLHRTSGRSSDSSGITSPKAQGGGGSATVTIIPSSATTFQASLRILPPTVSMTTFAPPIEEIQPESL